MGDIADGLIDGTFDSITGEYLGEGPGYPRTREKDCGLHYYEKDHSNSSKARGVTKWLTNHGFKHHTHVELMKEFLIEHQPHLNMNRYKSDRQMKVHISGFCFNHFTTWILNHKQKKS